MTFYPDLGTRCMVDDGPHVRAIGWLARDEPYTQGSVPPEFVSALRRHTAAAWQPCAAGGMHHCELCGRERTSGNVWIPADDVVYVAPEMIVHYVEAHAYAPPEAFVRAVLACPSQESPGFFAMMSRFPSWWAELLPR